MDGAGAECAPEGLSILVSGSPNAHAFTAAPWLQELPTRVNAASSGLGRPPSSVVQPTASQIPGAVRQSQLPGQSEFYSWLTAGQTGSAVPSPGAVNTSLTETQRLGGSRGHFAQTPTGTANPGLDGDVAAAPPLYGYSARLGLYPGVLPGMAEATSIVTQGAELGVGKHGSGVSKRQSNKPRLVWTQELHNRFINAVNHLGVKNAVPKSILQLMNVEGMTRENVASHLQKYRLYLKKLAGVAANAPIPQDIMQQMQPQSSQHTQLQVALQQATPATLFQHGSYQLMGSHQFVSGTFPQHHVSFSAQESTHQVVPQPVHLVNLPSGQGASFGTSPPVGHTYFVHPSNAGALQQWQGVPLALGGLQYSIIQSGGCSQHGHAGGVIEQSPVLTQQTLPGQATKQYPFNIIGFSQPGQHVPGTIGMSPTPVHQAEPVPTISASPPSSQGMWVAPFNLQGHYMQYGNELAPQQSQAP